MQIKIVYSPLENSPFISDDTIICNKCCLVALLPNYGDNYIIVAVQSCKICTDESAPIITSILQCSTMYNN